MSRRFPLLALVRELPGTASALTLTLAVVIAVAGVAPALAALDAGQLIDRIPAALAARSVHSVILWLLLLAALFLVQQLAGAAALQLADSLGRRVTGSLRDRVMAAALAPADLGPLERPEVQNLLASATEVGTARTTAQEAVVAGVSIGMLRLQGICCAVVLAGFSWWLALTLLIAYFFLAWAAVRDFRAGARASATSDSVLRRSGYLQRLGVDPGAAKDLRLFGLRGWLDWRFHEEWLAAVRQLRRADGRDGRLGAKLAAVVLASQLAVYGLLGAAVARGDISTGAFVAYAGAVLGVLGVLAVSPDNVNLALGARAVPRVAELEQLVGSSPHVPAPSQSPPATLTHGISIRDLWFTYPGGTMPVFSGLNLDIAAGQSLAIVGLNGAGKTTLIKLICGLYQPSRGAILIDGVPLTSIDPHQWREKIAAVFQDFVRFHLTAEDNVCFGSIRHADDREGIESSVELVGAAGFLDQLPDGWASKLSDGQELSGGQWQRLALARAVFALRHGARLLILDEPTAALDVRAEAAIYQQLLVAASGVTSIIISHRFSTVRPADRIVVLSGGQIIEDGTHAALLRADGEYARMFTLQARSFTDPVKADACVCPAAESGLSTPGSADQREAE